MRWANRDGVSDPPLPLASPADGMKYRCEIARDGEHQQERHGISETVESEIGQTIRRRPVEEVSQDGEGQGDGA